MASIRLHAKYGVNPTVEACFFCNRETGELALLGAVYKGEAPRSMVLNKEPCDKCKEEWARGIAVLEATNVNGKPDPTGRMVVLTRDAASRVFRLAEVVEQVLHHGRALMDVETFTVMFADHLGGVQ